MDRESNETMNSSRANTSNLTLPEDTDSNFRFAVLWALFSVNAFSFVSNVLIVCIVHKTKRFHGVTKTIVINTALADIVLDVVCIFLLQEYRLNARLFQEGARLILLTVVVGIVFEISYSMTGTTFALYLAVCHQLTFTRLTVRKTVGVILLSWLLNIGLAFLHFSTDFYKNDNVTSAVVVTYDATSWWYGCILLTNAIVIPFIAIVVCFHKIRKFCLLTKESMPSGSGFRRSVKMLALARMNIVCFMTFILSWSFIHFVQVLRLSQGWSALAMLLVCSYRVLKFEFYLYFYPPFRQTVRTMVCCVCRHKPSSSECEVTTISHR